MNPVNVGLLGLGTVGGGTFNVLNRNANEITRRAGRGIRISHAAARDFDPARLPGITPAAIVALLRYVKRREGSASSAA
ncbi:MAG: hypothetical protein P8X52_07860 [Limibacillus sp.]